MRTKTKLWQRYRGYSRTRTQRGCAPPEKWGGIWSSRRGKTDRRKGNARSRDNHTCITNRKKNEQHFSRITIEHHEPLLYFSSASLIQHARRKEPVGRSLSAST